MKAAKIFRRMVTQTAIVLICLFLGSATHFAHAADPDAAINRLLKALEKNHGLKFSPIRHNRRSIELAVPESKDRTHVVYLFAPQAAVIFGQRYITLYGFAAPSRDTTLLKMINKLNASTVLGSWFVGQNNLLTYKIVVSDNTSPADVNNFILLVAGAADAKEKELTGGDKY